MYKFGFKLKEFANFLQGMPCISQFAMLDCCLFLLASAIYVNRGLQHVETAAGRGPQERNSYAKQAGAGADTARPGQACLCCICLPACPSQNSVYHSTYSHSLAHTLAARPRHSPICSECYVCRLLYININSVVINPMRCDPLCGYGLGALTFTVAFYLLFCFFF